MPLEVQGITLPEVHSKIRLLTENLVSISDTTGEFLLRLADGRVVDTKGWNDWEWTHGIGLRGLWAYYQLTGETATRAIITDWFAERFAVGGTSKNINTMAAMYVLAALYEEDHDRTYLPHLEAWAEWAMHELPRTRAGGMQHITYSHENAGQLWADTLVMTALPLAKIGKVLGRPEYVDEALRQVLLHIQVLWDPPTGLFFHAWQFRRSNAAGSSGIGGHNFANARWARGNAWLTIAIPDFIELLEMREGDPVRKMLQSVLEAQVNALVELQGEEGLWRTLLDVSETDGSYSEASASAGFAYGILKALRKRYITELDNGRKKIIEGMAITAVQSLLRNVDERGELAKVSFGTPVFDTLDGYLAIKRTSMPYGQAMAMMAFVEFLRLYY